MAESDLIVFGVVCPRCHGGLMVRTNRSTGERFVGCAGALLENLGCGFTRNLSEREVDEVFRMVKDGKVGVNFRPEWAPFRYR